jgi:hypothetical protein
LLAAQPEVLLQPRDKRVEPAAAALSLRAPGTSRTHFFSIHLFTFFHSFIFLCRRQRVDFDLASRRRMRLPESDKRDALRGIISCEHSRHKKVQVVQRDALGSASAARRNNGMNIHVAVSSVDGSMQIHICERSLAINGYICACIHRRVNVLADLICRARVSGTTPKIKNKPRQGNGT